VLLPPLFQLLFCVPLLPHTPQHLPAQGVLASCVLPLLLLLLMASCCDLLLLMASCCDLLLMLLLLF
jgi:hypothetical protein